jgi:hypothetical protein
MQLVNTREAPSVVVVNSQRPGDARSAAYSRPGRTIKQVARIAGSERIANGMCVIAAV